MLGRGDGGQKASTALVIREFSGYRPQRVGTVVVDLQRKEKERD
jgi:hypothetical protein